MGNLHYPCPPLFPNITSEKHAISSMSSSIPPALISLRRQHHSLHPSYLLRLAPPEELATPANQTFLVDYILNDPVIHDVQPERGYRRSFWKRIVIILEEGVKRLQVGDPENADVRFNLYLSRMCRAKGEQEYEVDDQIYEALAESMISDPSSSPSDMYLSLPRFTVAKDDTSRPKQSYRTFLYDQPIWAQNRGEGKVTLLEEQVAIQAGTTGLRTWYGKPLIGTPICH